MPDKCNRLYFTVCRFYHKFCLVSKANPKCACFFAAALPNSGEQPSLLREAVRTVKPVHRTAHGVCLSTAIQGWRINPGITGDQPLHYKVAFVTEQTMPKCKKGESYRVYVCHVIQFFNVRPLIIHYPCGSHPEPPHNVSVTL